MAAPRIDVSPDVLVWARETMGLTRDAAARRLGMSDLDLHYLEEGADSPRVTDLRKMAKVYDRPFLVFFLPSPPDLEDSLPDFRTTPRQGERAWSPELHAAYRRVTNQREAAIELAELNDDEQPPTVDVSLAVTDDPEEGGSHLRTWLKAPEAFEEAEDSREIYNEWVSLVEDRGVIVAQVTGIAVDEMRGFSIAERPFPAIAINNKDAYAARSFTLLHELVHIALHNGGLCDLVDPPQAIASDVERVERFCNEVAAAALAPLEMVLREPLVIDAPRDHRWQYGELQQLARPYGISAETMLLRLVTLGRVSRDYYWEHRHALFQYTLADFKTKSGGGDYYRNTLRALGRRYISTVWKAYQREDINAADLTRYLFGVKYKNVDRLIDTMQGR